MIRTLLAGSIGFGAIPSCTSIRAAYDLGRSHPVCGVSVARTTSSSTCIIEWRANYRNPPPIDSFAWVPSYTVTRNGEFTISGDPDLAVSVLDDDRKVLDLKPREAVQAQRCSVTRNLADDEHCNDCPKVRGSPGHVILRFIDHAENRARSSIEATAADGLDAGSVDLPIEAPFGSPERWGWLLISPAVDAVVLPANLVLWMALAGMALASGIRGH